MSNGGNERESGTAAVPKTKYYNLNTRGQHWPHRIYTYLVYLPVGLLITELMHSAKKHNATLPDEKKPSWDQQFGVVAVFSIGVVAGVYILVTVSALFLFPDFLLSLLSSPLAAVFVLAVGLALYWVRCKYLYGYAIVEILVASIAIWVGIRTMTDSLLVKSITLMGGIYILVRGLDNLDKSIPSYSTFRRAFDRYVKGNRNVRDESKEPPIAS